MDAVTADRIALLRAGYIPTPCDGKQPILHAWQERLQPSEADIEQWREQRPAAINTGSLTRINPTFDIDVLNAVIADRIEALTREHAKDGQVLVRYGLAPKRAIPFRLVGEPFKKLRTPIFIDANGNENKVEVLADGQQFIVSGTHPDTAKPYTWRPQALQAVAYERLPSINECEASILIEQITALLRATGWKEKGFRQLKTISQRAAASVAPSTNNREQAYGAKALENATDEVANAVRGERNDVLNAKAYSLGRQVAAGRIDQVAAERALIDAANKSGLIKDDGIKAVENTITSGMNAGMQNPAAPLADSDKQNADPFSSDRRQQGSKDKTERSAENNKDDDGLIALSSREFVANFVAPDPLIESILQRGFLYALTAHTGRGKSALALLFTALIALGRSLGYLDVEQGRCLYLAGENHTDIRYRWIAMAQQMDFDPDAIDVHFIEGRFSIPRKFGALKRLAERLGGFDFIVVDSSAAFFDGDDENNNAQAGRHASNLRELTTLPGNPCVLALCHPPKNAGEDNLQPRGGGAYVAEIDGNLTATKDDMTITLYWQTKLRGADFTPINFLLRTVTHERLVSKTGKLMPTVVASLLTDAAKDDMAKARRLDEDRLLQALNDNPTASLADLATKLNWLTGTGLPHKSKVHRSLERLQRDKLVTKDRDRYVLTEKGKKAVKSDGQ